MWSKTYETSGVDRIFFERLVEIVAHVLAGHADDGSDGRHLLQRVEQGAPLLVGVLLDHPVQIGIDVRERGHHQRGQARQEAAVEPPEGVAQVPDGRAEHRAHDVEFRRVFGAHFGGPCAGQAAPGVPPQPDRGRLGQPEPLRAQRGPDAVQDPVAGLIRRPPQAAQAFVVGHGDGPALGDGGGDQEEFELADRPEGLRPAAQRIGREAARRHGVDRALVRQHRAGTPRGEVGRDDHRRRGRLRLAVHVHGPVEQLDGLDGLRDQAEEGQLDVARAQHRPGLGVLESQRRLVERVVRGQQRTHLGLQFLVGRPGDPFRAMRACQVAELSH